MFEGMKGMAGLAGLMKDLPKIKAKMQEVKQRLGERSVSAETGGGAVRVTANGLLRVVSVHIDQALLSGLIDSANPDDRAIAEELIAGAVNSAMERRGRWQRKRLPAPRAKWVCPFHPVVWPG